MNWTHLKNQFQPIGLLVMWFVIGALLLDSILKADFGYYQTRTLLTGGVGFWLAGIVFGAGAIMRNIHGDTQ